MGAPIDTPWSDDDRAWAMALVQYERSLCSCGEPLTESLDPANEFAYVAEFIRCHACAATERANRALPEATDRAGLRINVKRKEGL